MFIPTREFITNMTPMEFEKYSIELLKSEFANKGIEKLSFQHNIIEKIDDEDYQIDGEIRFTLMVIEYLTLVECKYYKNPIKREQIQVLKDKIQEIGAHKGIFISTSNFQSGALNYAAKHGIATITIIDGKLTYHTRDMFNTMPKYYPEDLPEYVLAFQKAKEESISVSYLSGKTSAIYDFIVK